MSGKQTTNGKEKEKEFDPTESFREMRDTYMDAWAKGMVDTVNSDAYAKASGMMLNTYLSTSSPFREAVEKVMLQALQQCSMPSRADVVSLAERTINIEMRLDDMDAKLDGIVKLLTGPAPAKRNRTPKTARGSRRKGAK
jgi:hypothetical protein